MKEFNQFLEEAIKNLDQAVASITVPFYPSMNIEKITEMNKSIRHLKNFIVTDGGLINGR